MKENIVHMVVVIFFKKIRNRWRILVGESRNPCCKGFWIPLGGHMDPGEDKYDTAVHESRDEGGLTVERDDLRHIGEYTVKFADGTTRQISFMEALSWAGELRWHQEDFREMQFLTLQQLLRRPLLPGDKEVYQRIFARRFFFADVQCGNNRHDLKRIAITDLAIPELYKRE